MSTERGILYIVWGDKVDAVLERSIQSVRAMYPNLPIHIERCEHGSAGGLILKSRMGELTPFQTTLYLDADTIVLGNLDFAFEKAETFGLACSINECPWMRRYGQDEGDRIEYNTGVLFFTRKAEAVFSKWKELAQTTPGASIWLTFDGEKRGLLFDDQASFSRAIERCGFNPFVLPINFNFRPEFNQTFFAPIKIWHDYVDIAPGLRELSHACESGARPVTRAELKSS